MKDYFEYRGYIGSAEVDSEDMVLMGKLLFIRDVIAYSGNSPKELEQAFREAVDDYLATCAKYGDEPDTPCKGTFNVRVGPEIHRDVALAARRRKNGLNDFVRDALLVAVGHANAPPVQHVHDHKVTVTVAPSSAPVVMPFGNFQWESRLGTAERH